MITSTLGMTWIPFVGDQSIPPTSSISLSPSTSVLGSEKSARTNKVPAEKTTEPGEQDMTIIKDWEQVPKFTEDREEAVFWEEAQVDVRLMDASVVAGSTANESVTITLRMDPRMLARVKRIARSRFLNYQSMIKQWLSERMEQEAQKLES